MNSVNVKMIERRTTYKLLNHRIPYTRAYCIYDGKSLIYELCDEITISPAT
jgi:hypothetical protein